MSDKKVTTKRRFLDATGLLILPAAFLALIMVSNVTLRSLRLDLTENQLYSLADGTRSILASLEQPVTLKFFFSDQATREDPAIRRYAQRVQDLLEEYERAGGGMVNLEIIDPLPFSEAEDEAAGYGLGVLQSAALAEPFYFGLVGLDESGEAVVAPAFQAADEAFLEYDVSKLIYTLTHPERPIIGLISGLPVAGGWNTSTRTPEQSWAAYQGIEQIFEVKPIAPGESHIPDDIELLLVIHPKNLPQSEIYAIDQFVLRGGRLMVFVDPLAETDTTSMDPQNPLAGGAGDRSSDLPELFAAWGVDYDPTRVVVDRNLALPVTTSGPQSVDHIAMLGVTTEQINQDDVATGLLGLIHIAMAGRLAPSETGTTTFTSLITTTDDAMTLPVDRFFYLDDFDSLRDGYTPGGSELIIAARIEGDVDSAFGDAPPEGVETNDLEHLSSSQVPANIIVVADADLLADMLWAQVQSFFGQRVVSAFADNGNLLNNGLDNLSGSSDLISVRGGQSYRRPFEKVAELRRQADGAFRAKELELQQQLDETEKRLTELQSGDNDGQVLTMNEEQSAEIERYMDQRLQIRKELRQVRHELDRSIEQLGNRLALLNILTVPLLLTVLAIALWLLRRRAA